MNKAGMPGAQDAEIVAAARDYRLNEEYGQSARILLRIIKIELFFIVILAAGIILMLKNGRPEDRTYAMTYHGAAIPLQPIREPSVNVNAMLSWVSQVTSQVLTFGFNDVDEKLLATQHYFTDVGWESFRLSLQKSSLIQNIVNNQQLMTAIPSGTPEVLWSGLRKGDYVWDVKVPIILTVRAGGRTQRAFPNLIVVVKKVPTQRNPRGLGLDQWLMY